MSSSTVFVVFLEGWQEGSKDTDEDHMETMFVGVDGGGGRDLPASLVTINQPGTDPRTDALLGLWSIVLNNNNTPLYSTPRYIILISFQ